MPGDHEHYEPKHIKLSSDTFILERNGSGTYTKALKLPSVFPTIDQCPVVMFKYELKVGLFD